MQHICSAHVWPLLMIAVVTNAKTVCILMQPQLKTACTLMQPQPKLHNITCQVQHLQRPNPLACDHCHQAKEFDIYRYCTWHFILYNFDWGCKNTQTVLKNAQLWQNSCGRLTLSRVHSCGSSFSSGPWLLVRLGPIILPPDQPVRVIAPYPVGVHLQIYPIIGKVPFHLKSRGKRFWSRSLNTCKSQ